MPKPKTITVKLDIEFFRSLKQYLATKDMTLQDFFSSYAKKILEKKGYISDPSEK